MKLMVATLFCLGIAGCQVMPPVVVQLPPADSCGAAGLSGYTGGPVTNLPATGSWGTLRVIRPGMMVTMDYSGARLNARVDAAGRIVTLTCG